MYGNGSNGFINTKVFMIIHPKTQKVKDIINFQLPPNDANRSEALSPKVLLFFNLYPFSLLEIKVCISFFLILYILLLGFLYPSLHSDCFCLVLSECFIPM